ncbi:HNH endonuclease [Pseudonocardia sp. C8]|uniref:HNH endonuclease signature motif containing protein n=1 Tax=Pseudonocardia sp. C8 TaxID=2762759 RepID=UPI001642A6FB|nr:HNH endonuclease signature motif containing protein [Pseudonocardia sp. C8]MBC3192397.1 HNH endonuclease [Pseudonocardia sp. C8]
MDPDGYLLLAGPLRRRPRTRAPNDRNGPKPPGAPQTPRTPGAPGTPPPVRGGVVELHISLDELDRYAADPQLAGWHPLLAEIARAWADRDTRRARLDADPTARFARGPLATHVQVRDRTCVGPGCTRPARRSELDHTTDHDHGGPTVPANIGPCCGRHHADKDRGWTLTQPEPGRFCWRSPLGRTYRTRGEPVRPDLPDPDPDAEPREEPGEQSAAETDRDLRKHDTPLLRRPATDPPLPPPPQPKPKPKPDDEPPPF